MVVVVSGLVGLEELLQGDEPQRNRGLNGTLTAPPACCRRTCPTVTSGFTAWKWTCTPIR